MLQCCEVEQAEVGQARPLASKWVSASIIHLNSLVKFKQLMSASNAVSDVATSLMYSIGLRYVNT